MHLPRTLVAVAVLALPLPSSAKPLGSCAVSVAGEVTKECAVGACRCLSVSNACPFPVNVVYETGEGQRTVGVQGGGASTDACAVETAPHRLSFLAWRPFVGYPMAGHPVPIDGVSMTGPVSETP